MVGAAQAQYSYGGFCDASAAVAIGPDHFLVSGDEYNRPDDYDRGETINRGSFLYLYKTGVRTPKKIFPLPLQMRDNLNRELDVEAATRIGKRVYWITSHGRNKNGKRRPNRYRLFATDVSGSADKLSLRFVGSYRNLVEQMLDEANWVQPGSKTVRNFIEALYRSTQLDVDLSKRERRKLAPKANGLNIEGLAASRDGKRLLIGLRNPLINARAAVVMLMNGDDLITGRARRARFAGPYLLDLDRKGIRGMEYSPLLGAFVVIAGPTGGSGRFELMSWKGPGSETVKRLTRLIAQRGSNPESVVVSKNSSTILVINDEGKKITPGGQCNSGPVAHQSFTAIPYSKGR